jgi:hypothetical protein
MLSFVLAILAAVRAYFRSRTDTPLEILALRQQVAVLERRRPRPPLDAVDRLFWTVLRQAWARWKDVLVMVKPETVMAGTVPASASIGVGAPGRAVAGRG